MKEDVRLFIRFKDRIIYESYVSRILKLLVEDHYRGAVNWRKILKKIVTFSRWSASYIRELQFLLKKCAGKFSLIKYFLRREILLWFAQLI